MSGGHFGLFLIFQMQNGFNLLIPRKLLCIYKACQKKILINFMFILENFLNFTPNSFSLGMSCLR